MEDDLKSASKSMDQPYTRPIYHPSPIRKRRQFPTKTVIFILILILTVITIIAAKKYIHIPKKTAYVQTAIVPITPKIIKKDVDEVTAKEAYSSTALNVGFNYPQKWKVSEASGGIRVDSPRFIYSSLNDGSIEGIFRVYIRQGARKVDSPYIGASVAIKPSEKILYTQPAVGQRSDTLLSFFGKNNIDHFTMFMIVANFQLNKGDTLGPTYGSEPDTYIIAGGYTTNVVSDDLAMNSVALNYYDTTSAYKQAREILASLKLK